MDIETLATLGLQPLAFSPLKTFLHFTSVIKLRYHTLEILSGTGSFLKLKAGISLF